MGYPANVIEAIGNTPLITLRRASEATGCTILGKAEFMNPGGSVKDRAALAIIEDAIRRGALKPGGLIVEGTAGNTGIGLALVANALGFQTVIVIPDTQSQEKKDLLRLQGAELIEVPAVPYSDPNNYVKLSGRLAERLAKRASGGRDLGQSIRQSRQPPGPYRDHRPRNLGADRRARRRLRQLRRHRRHAGRRRHCAEGEKSAGQDRPRRSARRGALFLLYDRRTEILRLVDHRRHRARPDHRQSARMRRSISPIRSAMKRRCPSSTIWPSTKDCCSAARRASMSRARSASQSSWVPATRS